MHFRTDKKPDLLFTDRGQGFYALKNGAITSDYQQALQTHGLSTVMGTNAQKQPGDLKDVLLHETAVSWLTHRLTVTLPPKPWEETVPDFLRRLHAACEYVHTHYDVDSLCRAWPERITKLVTWRKNYFTFFIQYCLGSESGLTACAERGLNASPSCCSTRATGSLTSFPCCAFSACKKSHVPHALSICASCFAFKHMCEEIKYG